MVFSHCSTFGPRMKCCESSTSAMAASMSALMARYCALRSRRGTFILGFLIELLVRLGADRQLRWQRSFLVEIEAAEHTRFGFLIAIATFRTPHDAVRISALEPVAVTAHPRDLPGRIPDDQRKI